jgi:hypothetical protein
MAPDARGVFQFGRASNFFFCIAANRRIYCVLRVLMNAGRRFYNTISIRTVFGGGYERVAEISTSLNAGAAVSLALHPNDGGPDRNLIAGAKLRSPHRRVTRLSAQRVSAAQRRPSASRQRRHGQAGCGKWHPYSSTYTERCGRECRNCNGFNGGESPVATPEGFEPPTLRIEV